MKKIKNVFPKTFRLHNDSEDPSELDFRIYGMHKRETFDGNGDLTLLEYFKDYDAVASTFSGIAVKENRIYVRDATTGLPLTRITDIDWYDEDGNVQLSKLQITKYFSAKKGFVANKRARRNIIEKASMYLYSALIQSDPANVSVNIDNFESLTDSAASKYIKSNTQPLLDIITNSTDNTKPEYRDYITTEIRAILLAILNVTY